MSTDNRTEINDCEANTGWAGDDTANPDSDAGSFYEGAGSLSTQLSNVDEHMYTTEDSLVTGTFSFDWSDTTLYMLVKDNLKEDSATGGAQFVIGDGTDRIGYDVGGNDAVGLPLPTFFHSHKLDVSVIVTTPGVFAVYAGSEVNLDQTVITQIGYGTIHPAKAVGAVDNVWMDYFSYIANDSYALTINGGTVGTPETMADVVGDDVTNGWGLISNPLGSQYLFFGPTEWGESGVSADHYFTANGEQWYWLGDNGGGHAVGATHFPFRLISNATNTGSFVISNVSIVNTGTRAELLMDDANFETIELDGCALTGTGTISLPSAGGTSRFTTNTVFTDCDQITQNGADMTGSSVLLSNAVADTGALLYNETADPDGELDDMVFSQGAAAHHAIDFGTAVTSNITLRGCAFDGFDNTADSNGAAFRFLAGSGSLTLNLVDCTVDGAAATESNIAVDDAAGIVVSLSISPITAAIHVNDENGDDYTGQLVRVYVIAKDGTGPMPYQDVVTITNVTTTATVTHTAHGLKDGQKILIEDANEQDYNGVSTITFVDVNTYDYTMPGDPGGDATGTILATAVLFDEFTDATGDVSDQRVLGSNQPIIGWARKGSAAPFYEESPIDDEINSLTGFSLTIKLVLDE